MPRTICRPLFLSIVLAMGLSPLAASPAGAILPAGFDCGPDDGREQITTDGFQLTFESPATTAPELAAANHPAATAHRTAQFPFRANFVPYTSGNLAITLTWPDTSDFDIFVFDAEGGEIGRSDASNIDGGDTRVESVTVEGITHCQDFLVQVKSWAGRPDLDLTLKIEFQSPGPAFACGFEDPHPSCAGKAEGEAPARVTDARPRLYAGGDPGQVSMVYATGGGATPFRSTLEPARPTTGTPNSYTRPVAGFRDQYQNPFIPAFVHTFAEPRTLRGDAHALVWVSSPTLQQEGGILYVDLYVDGGLFKEVPIPGAQVPSTPGPISVRFPALDFSGAESVALQVGTTPAVSTGGPGNPADALFTIHYGSVQFPTRLTLP